MSPVLEHLVDVRRLWWAVGFGFKKALFEGKSFTFPGAMAS
jgi:hypothetical protein